MAVVNMKAQIFVLIGRMLGANQRWAEGDVSVVQRHADGSLQDSYVEHFWHSRQRLWRVERSDGPLFAEEVGVQSRTRINGRVESGPSAGVGRFAAAQLLQPSSALIWGRPGEDWRIGGGLSEESEGLLRLELRHVDDSVATGYAIVDERTGVIHKLNLGRTELTLDRLEELDSRGSGEGWLLQL